MVENSGIQLTEHEAELYDRQIRLWGLEAQKSLRNARVLVIGLDGYGAEIVKNIVLSGVKAVTLLDPKKSTNTDRMCQFLIPSDKIGQNRAEGSQERAQALNPLVAVEADPADPAAKPESFFVNFEVIVTCGQTVELNLRLDKLSRKNDIKFFAGAVIGTFGWIFIDLQEHEFVKDIKKLGQSSETRKTVRLKYEYPPLEEVLGADYKGPSRERQLRRQTPLFFLFRILQNFYKEFQRNPADNAQDIEALTILREKELDGVSYHKENFPDVIFRCLSGEQPNPVCAILGAMVAQEIVKAVTKKEAPIINMFFFDPLSLSGHVQAIPPEIAPPLD